MRTMIAICLATVLVHADEPRFQAVCREKAAGATTLSVTGLDGWLFLKSELRHLGVGRFWGTDDQMDPLPAIVDYHEQLQKFGIQLLVVPAPPKAVVYAEKLLADLPAGRLDPVHQEFYRVLREKGVEVIDLVPELLAHRQAGMYCRQDTHWSGQAVVRVAGILAERIQKMDWYANAPKTEFTATTREIEITGDLADAAAPKEKLTVRHVGTTPDAESPVLLLGDSHCLVFHTGNDMLSEGAGLVDQLAYELKMPVDLLGVRGSGARPARTALFRRGQTAGYLTRKKVIIWCFATREFTEASGWGKVPVTR